MGDMRSMNGEKGTNDPVVELLRSLDIVLVLESTSDGCSLRHRRNFLGGELIE